METVRLEKSATFHICSLDLENTNIESGPWAVLSHPLPHPRQPGGGALLTTEDNPVRCHPLILTGLDVKNNQTMNNESSAQKQDASAASKLIFVMAAFLVCWLPYFVWLPTVHILVSCRYSLVTV